jgi:flavin-binding protein dodecin
VDRTYKIIELVGTSDKSYEEAIQNAISKAAQSLKALSWFEIVQMRGAISDGKVTEYQVDLKIGFKLVN